MLELFYIYRFYFSQVVMIWEGSNIWYDQLTSELKQKFIEIKFFFEGK